VLAFGGGVAGDLGGLVASLYMRGVPLVQVPTTLLAMVDASIGGKTAVDLPEGKNLAGTFHQPLLVAVDPDLLATLPARQRRAGLAEVLKAALLAGGGPWERVRRAPRLQADAIAVDRMIRDAVRLKARIVSADERESGLRRVLNLGHTLGHALEVATGYGHYLHGEAVAVGICYAALLSRELCGLRDATVEEILRLAAPLARRPPEPRPGLHRLMAAAVRDKKARGGRLAWVLLEAPGRPRVVTGVPRAALARAAAVLVRRGLL
jgi:3-dehydroquinate synthetase